MKELEKLLNSLIQRGWKPFEIDWITNVVYDCWKIVFRQKGKYSFSYSIREIVSLESGLWQFWIEQKLCRDVEQSRAIHSTQSFATGPSYSSIRNHQYRLLESALIPEEELGKFLVDNIKVECKKE